MLESPMLGVSFRAEGKCVRLRNLRIGRDLLNIHEVADARRAAVQARQLAERQRFVAERRLDAAVAARRLAEKQRDAAEERIAELETRLRELGARLDDDAK